MVLHRENQVEELGSLESRFLFDDPLLAMLPQGHPAGRSGQVRLADLAGERLVMISRAAKPLVFDRILRLCREAGFEPEVVEEVGEPMALALAVGGQGFVSLTGAGMANRYAGVDYLPVAPLTGIAKVSAFWSENCVNPLVPEFVGLLDPDTVLTPHRVRA